MGYSGQLGDVGHDRPATDRARSAVSAHTPKTTGSMQRAPTLTVGQNRAAPVPA
jgi:hypothetical protein